MGLWDMLFGEPAPKDTPVAPLDFKSEFANDLAIQVRREMSKYAMLINPVLISHAKRHGVDPAAVSDILINDPAFWRSAVGQNRLVLTLVLDLWVKEGSHIAPVSTKPEEVKPALAVVKELAHWSATDFVEKMRQAYARILNDHAPAAQEYLALAMLNDQVTEDEAFVWLHNEFRDTLQKSPRIYERVFLAQMLDLVWV